VIAPAFFVPDGDAFVASEHTRGPWSPQHQHAGPPAALIGRALSRAVAPEPFQLARITIDLLRPVPIGRLSVRVEPRRTTRRTRILAAVLSAEGVEVATASAIFLLQHLVALPELPPPPPPPTLPESLPAFEFPFFADPVGYHAAMEGRFAQGGFGQARSSAWMRMRLPLVLGETPSPLERVLVAADSGNGITNVLDHARYTFMNPDLTVALHRLPVGEWVCLEAYTQPEDNGVGLAHSRLYDPRGPLGHAVQTLIIAAR